MYEIRFTKGTTNLRSTPFAGDPGNIIATLPSLHPVTILSNGGEAGTDWLLVSSVFENKNWQGYIAASTLMPGNGLYEPSRTQPTLPQREALLLDPDADGLKSHLMISKPSGKTPGTEALAFKRSRRIETSLADIFQPSLGKTYLDKSDTPLFEQSGNFEYFYRHWMGLWNNTIPDSADAAKLATFVVEGDFSYPKVNLVAVPVPAGISPTWGGRASKREVEWVDVKGFVLRHPIAKRYFYLEPVDPNVTIDVGDFADPAQFRQMLDKKIATLRQCIPIQEKVTKQPEATAQAESLLTDIQFVDLGPALILRQFSELEAIKDFADKLSTAADNIGIGTVNQLLDEQQVNALVRAVLTMKAPQVDRELRRAELIDKADALGYILATKAEKFVFEDGTAEDLEPGKLYAPYETTVSWVTEHKRQSSYSSSGFFGIGASGGTREWTEFVTHTKQVTKHRQVRVDLDPFSDREEALSRAGFTSFRFERIGGRLITAEGIGVEDVMHRCEYDEDFRARCAVWLPVYEQKLSKGLLLTKYMIVMRPHKGIRPVRMPRMYFEEGLAYRTSWNAAELGELVYTMNLAPGEERTVTIEQKVARTTEETRSTVSILDLTESASQDLTTEIEKEARSTSEQSSSNSWSAGASGSYGAISGTANSAGDNKQSTSQFARSFERITKKAASNITRNTKQEVRSSTSIKTDASRTEATAIKIRNINEGRTLNLLFYRLYNVLNTTLHLEDLSVLIEPGIEVVAGSGITVPTQLPIEQLETGFSAFDPAMLPFSIKAAPDSIEYTATYRAYWHLVLRKFVDLFEKDYFGDDDQSRAKALSDSFAAHGDELTRFKKRLEPAKVTTALTLDALEDEVRTLLIDLTTILTEVVSESDFSSKPLPHTEKPLRVASPGLYVDSLMGARPATEPYAEEMRAQTVMLRAAEAAKERALARYYDRLAGTGYPQKPEFDKLGVIAVWNKPVLVIKSIEPLRDGAWALQVDGQDVGTLFWHRGASQAELRFNGVPGWSADLDKHAYMLRHLTSPEAIPLTILDGEGHSQAETSLLNLVLP